MSVPIPHRRRRGFTLLEVMIALSILVVSLIILLETQTTAVMMTIESERILTASQLAQDKLAEVRFLVENEGFQDGDVYEDGDFDDFGDEALDVEFAELSSYHFEYLVTEIDLGLGGDIAGAMGNMQDSFGGGGADDGSTSDAPMSMGGLPVSEDMITEMLNPFIREVRVRVWWGEDQEEAEEFGNEVVITTFVIQPNANLLNAAGLGGLGGAAGAGAGAGQVNPNRNPGRAGRGASAASGCSWCFGGGGFGGFGTAPAGGGLTGPNAFGGAQSGQSSPTAPTRSIGGR
jgi:general secretion pathway protein I